MTIRAHGPLVCFSQETEERCDHSAARQSETDGVVRPGVHQNDQGNGVAEQDHAAQITEGKEIMNQGVSVPCVLSLFLMLCVYLVICVVCLVLCVYLMFCVYALYCVSMPFVVCVCLVVCLVSVCFVLCCMPCVLYVFICLVLCLYTFVCLVLCLYAL